MDELTQVLTEATASIDDGFFYLRIDGGDSVYRERVYCYELYHQMRLRWPKETHFYLNGEIDKVAHPILMKLGAAFAKPDLLVHRPGYMSGNHAIIEVKAARASNAGILKDLRTLSIFINDVGYERAIYLIYGHEADEAMIIRIKRTAASIDSLAPIEVWLHQKSGLSAIHVCNLARITKQIVTPRPEEWPIRTRPLSKRPRPVR